MPHLSPHGRAEIDDLGSGFYRVVLRHGFMEDVDTPAAMKAVDECNEPINISDTSYFLSRQTLIPSDPSRHGDLTGETLRLDDPPRRNTDGVFKLPTTAWSN